MGELPDVRGKKVLITGGLGFIGSNLAQTCVRLGAQVTIYDCLDPKSGGNMANLEGIRDEVHIILNDIRNFEGVCAAVLNQDILFSCAAYTSHPNSMREPLIDIDVNCKGVINILEAARRFNPGLKMVHVGTSTQVGRMVFDRINELHPEFPVDIYSANKSVSEKYMLIYGSAYDLQTTVVRLANIYGPRSNISSPDFGFVNYFIGLALRGQPLTVYGQGEQRRSLSYIDDAVSALLKAAVTPSSNGEVFFLASDRPYTVAEIAQTIATVFETTVRYVPWPHNREVIEIGDAQISNLKLRNKLQWTPEFDLERGLVATKNYFEPYLDKYVH